MYRAALSQAEIQTDMVNPVTSNPNAPKLVITAPAGGSTVSGGSVPIVYTTTGDLAGVDHVHFQVNGEPMKMDLTFDGAYTYPGVHVGSHTLDGWLVRADHSKIAGSDAVPVQFSNVVDSSDLVRPTAAITAPTGGASVSGDVALNASASDNVGVYGVRFKVDGAVLGVEDLRRRSPSLGHDDDGQRRARADGDRPRCRRQRDDHDAGNVTVANGGPDPAQVGSGAPRPRSRSSRSTPIMLANGRLLIFDSVTNSATNPASGIPLPTRTPRCRTTTRRTCSVPATRRFRTGVFSSRGARHAYVGTSEHDYLRSRHQHVDRRPTDDVRPLVPDPHQAPGRSHARGVRSDELFGLRDSWSCAQRIAAIPEIFDPASEHLVGASGASLRLPLYPHMYVLPDGRVFAATTAEDAIASRVLDLDSRTWYGRRRLSTRGRQLGDVPAGQDPEDGQGVEPGLPGRVATAEAWVIDMHADGADLGAR